MTWPITPITKSSASRWTAAYLDENLLYNLPVVPFDEVASVFPPDQHRMLIAVGYVAVNKLRAERYGQAKNMGYRLINFVSPRATTYPGLDIGDNCLISHNCVVSPDVKIGNDVSIGAGSMIGHDVIIGDHCFLSSGVGISGGVTVGPYCFLGTQATIRNRIRIGSGCVIRRRRPHSRRPRGSIRLSGHGGGTVADFQ